MFRLLALVPLSGLVACRMVEGGRVDSTALQHGATGPMMQVTILGDAHDPRVSPARKAINHGTRSSAVSIGVFNSTPAPFASTRFPMTWSAQRRVK